MRPSLLCCDWGTTTFRLRLMTISGQQCVGELSTPLGVAQTFGDWKTNAKPAGITQEDFFRQRLKTHIDQLAGQLSLRLDGIPILISGMASSSIGMAEVPYATLPFSVDGSQVSVRYVDSRPDFPHEVGLISGVSSLQDVMRGEETQLIGIVSLLGWTDDRNRKAVFLFPGTHAKHLFVDHDQLVHFDTYMTGELFSLMANHSILADSVDVTDLNRMLEGDREAFKRGVHQSTTTPVLASLFTVRTNGLFNTLTKRQNALYLSGLLIGSELGHLLAKPDWPLILCSSPNLATVYEWAIDELGLSARTTFVSPDLIDRAAPAGQRQLYLHEREKQLIP